MSSDVLYLRVRQRMAEQLGGDFAAPAHDRGGLPRRGGVTSQSSLLSHLSRWPEEDRHRDLDAPHVPCFTCGEKPVGVFHDGSPRYDHTHDRVTGEVWMQPRSTRGPDDARICPACDHGHPAGTTCLQCPICLFAGCEESEESEETTEPADEGYEDEGVGGSVLVIA